MIFLSAAIAHLLAVMSPSPDTAIIFQQSFVGGRAHGILTALGIGSGIFIPVSYTHLTLPTSDLV